MYQVTDDREMSPDGKFHRILSLLVWVAVCTGLGVSVCVVINELCLATACTDAASFTFFGVGMGWLGIAYFSLMVLLLWQRTKGRFVNLAFIAMVFSGSGAEFRLLWIQKYIIGSWCPYCVTICCALFATAILLLIEKVRNTGTVQNTGKNLFGWLAFVVVMMAAGFVIAAVGVNALT